MDNIKEFQREVKEYFIKRGWDSMHLFSIKLSVLFNYFHFNVITDKIINWDELEEYEFIEAKKHLLEHMKPFIEKHKIDVDEIKFHYGDRVY